MTDRDIFSGLFDLDTPPRVDNESDHSMDLFCASDDEVQEIENTPIEVQMISKPGKALFENQEKNKNETTESLRSLDGYSISGNFGHGTPQIPKTPMGLQEMPNFKKTNVSWNSDFETPARLEIKRTINPNITLEPEDNIADTVPLLQTEQFEIVNSCRALPSNSLPINKIEIVNQELEEMGSLSPILGNKRKKKRRVKRQLLPKDIEEQSNSTSASNSTSDVTKTPSASNTIIDVPELILDKDDAETKKSSKDGLDTSTQNFFANASYSNVDKICKELRDPEVNKKDDLNNSDVLVNDEVLERIAALKKIQDPQKRKAPTHRKPIPDEIFSKPVRELEMADLESSKISKNLNVQSHLVPFTKFCEEDTKNKINNKNLDDLSDLIEDCNFSQWEIPSTSKSPQLTNQQPQKNSLSLKLSKKNLSAELDNNTVTDNFATAGGKFIAVSEKKINEFQKMYEEINIEKSNDDSIDDFSLLKGNSIGVGDKKMNGCQNKPEETDIDKNKKPMDDFVTARGKFIAISDKKIIDFQNIYEEIDIDRNKKPMNDFATTEEKFVTVSDKKINNFQKVNEEMDISISTKSLNDFSTAGNKFIAVSKSKVNDFQKIYQETDSENDKGFATAGGKFITVSSKNVSNFQKIYDKIDVESTEQKDEIHTASKNNVFIKPGIKHRVLNHQGNKENVEITNKIQSDDFATAGGKNISVNAKNINIFQKAYDEMQMETEDDLENQILQYANKFKSRHEKVQKNEIEKKQTKDVLPNKCPPSVPNVQEESLPETTVLENTNTCLPMDTEIPSQDEIVEEVENPFAIQRVQDMPLISPPTEDDMHKMVTEKSRNLDSNYPTNSKVADSLHVINDNDNPKISAYDFDSEIEMFFNQLDTNKDIAPIISNNCFDKELLVFDMLQADKNNALFDLQAVSKEVEQDLSEFLSFAPKENIMDTVPLIETNPDNLQQKLNDADALENEIVQTIIDEEVQESPSVLPPDLLEDIIFDSENEPKLNSKNFTCMRKNRSEEFKQKIGISGSKRCRSFQGFFGEEEEQDQEIFKEIENSKVSNDKLDENSELDAQLLNISTTVFQDSLSKKQPKENMSSGFFGEEIQQSVNRSIKMSEFLFNLQDNKTLHFSMGAQEIITLSNLAKSSKVHVTLTFEHDLNLKDVDCDERGKTLMIPESIGFDLKEAPLSYSDLVEKFSIQKGSDKRKHAEIEPASPVLISKKRRTGNGISGNRKKLSFRDPDEQDVKKEESERRLKEVVLEQRSTAVFEQEKLIRSKKNSKILPITGTLLSQKLMNSNKKISLRSLTDDHGIFTFKSNQDFKNEEIDPKVVDITAANSLDYKFQLCRESPTQDSMCLKLSDDTLLIFDEKGLAGVLEFKRAFLAMAGVCTSLVCDGWVENHYRLIVWKLASLDRLRFKKQNLPRLLTADGVMKQLKYRYDREIDRAQRPALRRILEKDDVASKRLILCVSSIKEIKVQSDAEKLLLCMEQCRWKIEVTDGWYFIPVTIDTALSTYISSGKIKEGTKLITYGAELLECERGFHPLEVPANVSLKLHTNSTRRARWDAKLGYQKNSKPFPVRLKHVKEDGGLIGQLTVVAARMYPVVYLEKSSSGNSITRNARTEEKIAGEYEYKRQLKIDGIYSETLQKFEDKQKESPDSQGLVGSPMWNKKKQKYQETVENRLREELPPPRNVVPYVKIRISDQDCSAVVTIWRNVFGDEFSCDMKEGVTISIFNVTASGKRNDELCLTANRLTHFKRETLLKKSYSSRECVLIPDIIASKFITAFNEFDTIGIVSSIFPAPYGMKNFESVNIVYPKGDSGTAFLAVLFWNGVKTFGFEKVLTVGSFVACSNLQWRPSSSLNIPMGYCTEHSIFSNNPKQAHLAKSFNDLKDLIGAPVEYAEHCAPIIAMELSKKPLNRLSLGSRTNTPNKSSISMNTSNFDMGSPSVSKLSVQERLQKLSTYGQTPTLSPSIAIRNKSNRVSRDFTPLNSSTK